MARRRRDPDGVPAWARPAAVALEGQDPAPGAATAPAQERVTRTESRRSYTTQTPEELSALGYEQQPDGRWLRVTRQPDPLWQQAPAVALPTESEARAAEIAQDRLKRGDGLRSGGGAFVQGGALGFADEAAGLAAGGGQLVGNAFRRLTGQPIEVNSADLRSAMTGAVRAEQDRFAREQPVANVAAQVAGGLLTGGVGGGGRATIGNAARVGTGYGVAYGAGTAEGNIIDRLPSAAVGGATGAVGGAAIQGGLNAARPVIGGIAQRLGAIGRNGNQPPRQPIPRTADPETRAAVRLANTIDAGAVTERQRLQSLGIQPALADVAGGTTERLLRTAAAPAGDAANMTVNAAVSRTANLKPEIMSVTRGLADDPRSATQYRDALETARDGLATTEYREAYSAPVQLTPDAMAALRGADGEAAINRAIRGAEANQNYEQVDELRSLLTMDMDRPPVISGRSLDRVRIALRDMSSNFMRGENPDRVLASGYAGRVSGVDTALDSAPGLTDARRAFRERSGAIEAVDTRPDVFSTDPRDFAAWVRNLTPEQRQAAVIGVRQDILDTVGGQRNAGTGSLDTLAQASYSRDNLAALLGEQEAAQYLASITARVQGAQRFNRISPNTNSQTYGRGLDEDTFAAANAVGATVDGLSSLRGDAMAIGRTIDRVRSRFSGMSPQEREALVRFGVGSADDLERVVMLADQARRQGRPIPRQARRLLEGVRNTIGNTPMGQEIRNALVPQLTVAQEEEPPQ